MNIQKLLSPFRRAVNDYGLIKDGDKIAVGVSGGKDSLVLLTLMREFQKYFDIKFDLLGVTVDMGFADNAYAPIADYCNTIGVEYSVVKTDIAEIVFAKEILKAVSYFHVRYCGWPDTGYALRALFLQNPRYPFPQGISSGG